MNMKENISPPNDPMDDIEWSDKTIEKDGPPPEDQYRMMRAAFAEVLRLAAIGSKAELKGKPASKHKDETLDKHMDCMGFVGSFLNGVDEQYKEMSGEKPKK